MKSPGRIFLDTSVVNFIIEYSEQINDGAPVDHPKDRICSDILALSTIHYFANHNPIELIVSSTVLQEVQATNKQQKRVAMQQYCSELSRRFNHLVNEDTTVNGRQLQYFEEFLLEKGLDILTNKNDRRLILEALLWKCDIFCTRDYRTILKHRGRLKKLIPIQPLTPSEW